MYSQKFSFKNFGAEYGLPNSFIYSFNQAADGFIWIGTGDGLTRFDGYSYYPVNFPDSIERIPSVSVKDTRGNLWFGCNDGSVFFTRGNNLLKLKISNTRSISQMLLGPDSLIYIIPQGKSIFGVNPMNPGEISEYSISEEHMMSSASFTESGSLLIGTQGSVLICQMANDTIIVNNTIPDFNYYVVSSIRDSGNGKTFIVGTEGFGIFLLKVAGNDYTLTRFAGHPEWNSLDVKSIYTDQDNSKKWISTYGSGVIQFQVKDGENADDVQIYNTSTGLASDDARLVFQDSEGNYWFGLFGQGVHMLTSYAFSYYTPGRNSSENNILFVDSFNDKYILGTPSGFHFFDPVAGRSVSFNNLTDKTGGPQILSYFLDERKRLWIGSDGKGLYLRDADGGIRLFYRSGDSGADKINDIQVDKRNVWLATANGVIVLDNQNGALKKILRNNEGLPHNYINKILIDNDTVYVATTSDQLYMIDQLYAIDKPYRISHTESPMAGSTINKILALTKDKNGRIWAATGGNGVFASLNDSVSAKNRYNGLYSNYCFSIYSDSRNNIWIGHAKGFSMFNSETEIIKTYDEAFAYDGICNPDGMFESADGNFFIGTTEGLVVYDRKKENLREIPPFNNIISIMINDKRYAYQPSFELPYDKYQIVVYFTGINFSDPEKVFYQTYLENNDTEPSEMSSRRDVKYTLTDGKYKFNLLSVDENGVSGDSASFEIIIAKPIYKKWWFILAIISILTGIVALIIREREKAQRKEKEDLESELEVRTRLIMKQKGEIEIQNTEITDSINYAKRIQSSILPDVSKLRENFKDAFILFHPRDIVSGDFYWFDKLDDDKFILVCADSTGHGVPGAFMSMIGSTLLQDIVTRKRISRPSEILGMLDKQIFSTLNQNVDLGVSNDGMDMVICEFNIQTRHVRFASAMRPIILVMSGESHYIKGNRSSVGGESVIDKFFIDQEYYLNEGDTLYLFSDGLPDQFGGTDGKKMKIARLKKIIDQVSKLPMREQEKAMSDSFNEWKGDYEQVDDILLIGVRV
jgi:serine phosphatase RsbU (regulator of sigma subunit)/ligand-binding sensor domain-containing protein